MNDLRALGDRVVAEPPAPPPDFDELRRRRNRRSGRIAGAAAVVVVLAVSLAAIAMSRDDSDPQTVIADTTRTATTSPPTEAGPPPLGEVEVELVADPAVVSVEDPSTDVSYVNRSLGPVEVGCTFPRLDRWTGAVWSPLGMGFSAEHRWNPPTLDCETTVVPAGGSWRSDEVSLAGLEPGWYRWVVDGGAESGRREGRFIIGRDPEGTQERITAWLDVGDQLDAVGPLGDGDVSGFLVDDRLVVTWSSQCNVPLAAVTMRLEGGRLIAEPLFGRFMVIDCVGEPNGPWVAVVDIPAPLRRAPVELDDLRGTVETLEQRSFEGVEVLTEGAPHTWVPAAVQPTSGLRDGMLPLTWVADPCHVDDALVQLLLLDDLVVPMVRVPPACSESPRAGIEGGSWSVSDAAASRPLANQP